MIVPFSLYIAAITTAVFAAFCSRRTLLKVSLIAITSAFCAFAFVRGIRIRLSFIAIRFISVVLLFFAFVRSTSFVFVFRTTCVHCVSCYYSCCCCCYYGCCCCCCCGCVCYYYFSVLLN